MVVVVVGGGVESVTLIVSVPVAVPLLASRTWYVTTTGPVTVLAPWLYVTCPPLTVAVPAEDEMIETTSPLVGVSASLSLASSVLAAMASVVSSVALKLSPCATGVSLTDSTVRLTLACAVPPSPSLTV